MEFYRTIFRERYKVCAWIHFSTRQCPIALAPFVEQTRLSCLRVLSLFRFFSPQRSGYPNDTCPVWLGTPTGLAAQLGKPWKQRGSPWHVGVAVVVRHRDEQEIADFGGEAEPLCWGGARWLRNTREPREGTASGGRGENLGSLAGPTGKGIPCVKSGLKDWDRRLFFQMLKSQQRQPQQKNHEQTKKRGNTAQSKERNKTWEKRPYRKADRWGAWRRRESNFNKDAEWAIDDEMRPRKWCMSTKKILTKR